MTNPIRLLSDNSGISEHQTGETISPQWLGSGTPDSTKLLRGDGTWSSTHLSIEQNAQSGNYTLALTDNGKHVYSTNAGAQTITVPTNATIAHPVGTSIDLVNNGTTAITFTTTGTTVYKSGTSTAWASGGTLAVRGMATLLKVATDTWFISGNGLS